MGFGSRNGLGGSSTEAASLRGMYAIIPVAGLNSGAAAFLTPPFEVEGSSRHGFSSSIDNSEDNFHRSSAKSLGGIEPSEVTREDEFPVDDTFPPNLMPGGESSSADSRELLGARLPEAISDSSLRVLEGNTPHFLRAETGDLPGSFFDVESSGGRFRSNKVGTGGLFAKTWDAT